jgi:hypothetical protein
MSQAAGPAEDPAATPPAATEDETRRRFREALDRKQHQQHLTAAGAGQDGSQKSHGAAGPTKGRNFRRKAI